MIEKAETKQLRKALADIEVKGRLTPLAVVDAARDPSSVLHSHFLWDDAEAAHEHRIYQARNLIRGISIVVERSSKQIATVCYVRDPAAEARDQGYVSISRLEKEPDNAKAMLDMELARVDACLERAESLSKVFGIHRQVKTTRRRVAKLRETVEQHAAM